MLITTIIVAALFLGATITDFIGAYLEAKERRKALEIIDRKERNC